MKHGVYNTFLVGIFLVLLMGPADAATVAREVNRANELYDKGKFEDALQYYQKALAKDPSSALVQYNLGTAQYKKNSYGESVEHLQKALLTDDPQLQKKVRYNLGNALYKQGIAKESSDLSGAIEDLERSLSQYEKNLAAVPKDPDAQNNYDLVQKELQRLKEKQKQQQQEKQQDQQGQQQQDKSDQSQKDDQQNKDQEQGPSEDQNKNEQPQDKPKDQNKSDGNNDNPDQGNQGKDDQKPNDDAPKDGQDKKDQPPQPDPGAGETGGQPQEQNTNGSQANAQGLMTPQEAQMLLDDYQRNDEPKGMLYFTPQTDKSTPVQKDW